METVARGVGDNDAGNAEREHVADHVQLRAVERHANEVLTPLKVDAGNAVRAVRLTREFQRRLAAHHRDQAGIGADCGVGGRAIAGGAEVAVFHVPSAPSEMMKFTASPRAA